MSKVIKELRKVERRPGKTFITKINLGHVVKDLGDCPKGF